MKKNLLAAFMLLSICGYSQKFQVGIKAGVNISNFVGVNFEDATTKSLVGFHGGGFIGFFLGDHLSIQPEVLFSTQGTHFKDISSGTEEDFKMNYLNIPVMVKYEFDGGFFVETGPQAGINISSSKFDEMSVKDLTNGADFGWGIGIGYHSSIGLGIGARYIIGLSKVGNANFDDPDFRNSVIQIGLFYTIFNNNMHK